MGVKPGETDLIAQRNVAVIRSHAHRHGDFRRAIIRVEDKIGPAIEIELLHHKHRIGGAIGDGACGVHDETALRHVDRAQEGPRIVAEDLVCARGSADLGVVGRLFRCGCAGRIVKNKNAGE